MEEQIYTTKNLHLSSYLIANETVEYLGAEQDGASFIFRFTPLLKCAELQQAYYSGAEAPAVALFTAYNRLKDEIFKKRQDKPGGYYR